MYQFYYVVNTFDQKFNPIQRSGYVDASYERDAIQKLIDDGLVHEQGYEFLVLDYVDHEE